MKCSLRSKVDFSQGRAYRCPTAGDRWQPDESRSPALPGKPSAGTLHGAGTAAGHGSGVGPGGVPLRGHPAGGRQGARAGWGLSLRRRRRLPQERRAGRTRTAPRGCTSHSSAERGMRVLRGAPRSGGAYGRRRTGGWAGAGGVAALRRMLYNIHRFSES